MRGEHASTAASCAAYWGSSPHARGARIVVEQVSVQGGIIPACAGSTNAAMGVRVRVWDHPRMRGEHLRDGFLASASGGSSPHARGAP